MKKIIGLLLMTVFVLSACTSLRGEHTRSVETGIDSINKYGSITLTIGPESMKDLGYEPADIISVRIGDAEMDMPIGTGYTDADSGEPICCFKKSDSKGKDVVVLAINYDIIALDMTMNYESDDFRKDLADGFRYISSHEGPYLIHCVEGKDRTGFAAAILECLMGAEADEVVKDYMITYYNYYGIEEGTDQYRQIAASNIEALLAKAFGIRSIYDDGVDLSSCSEAFLKDIGMNDDEILSLRESLV